MEECIFCKICLHQLKSDIIHEDDKIIVFKDINPKAATHFLVAPKKHIKSLSDVGGDDWQIVLEMIQAAEKMAKELGLAGHKVVFNVGREGGQLVDHVHLHLLSGSKGFASDV